MLAYNLLSQNLASNSNNNFGNNVFNSNNNTISSSNTASSSPNQQQMEPIVIDSEEHQLEIEPKIEIPLPPPEPPKTMAERLVESIYTEITDFKTRHAALIVNDAGLTPIDLLKGQQHRSHAHSSRQQRLLLPDVAPSGLDPYTILNEREKRISQRAEKRKIELEESMVDENQRLPLGYLLDEYYDDTVRTASPDQLKSIIKLKSLQLRDKQTRVEFHIYIYICSLYKSFHLIIIIICYK
jgi:ATP-dependent helicase STH1/SNF2